MSVLEVEKPASMVEGTGTPLLPSGGPAVLSFEQQGEVLMLHMKLAVEKELQSLELENVLAIEKMQYEDWNRPS